MVVLNKFAVSFLPDALTFRGGSANLNNQYVWTSIQELEGLSKSGNVNAAKRPRISRKALLVQVVYYKLPPKQDSPISFYNRGQSSAKLSFERMIFVGRLGDADCCVHCCFANVP